MSEVIDVWVNCADHDEATRIAAEAIENRLAACANIFAPITSAFHWKGKVDHEEEVPLLLKTRADLFDELARLVERVHSYETPAIIGIRAEFVNAAYEEWVVKETKSAL